MVWCGLAASLDHNKKCLTLITFDMMSILKESSWKAIALAWLELAEEGFAGTETMKLNESEEGLAELPELPERVCTYRTFPFSNCRL